MISCTEKNDKIALSFSGEKQGEDPMVSLSWLSGLRLTKEMKIGKSSKFQVQRISHGEVSKRLFFAGISEYLEVPRWSCVQEGGWLQFEKDRVFVTCEQGSVQLLPIYLATKQVKIGQLSFEFIIKELNDVDELNAYRSLTEFHYRKSSLVGRRAKLVVYQFHPLYPKIVGFIELTTPFFMNKARSRILNSEFGLKGVEWTQWDVETRRRFTNLIVRIARCVVYPEFRGIGLGQLLVEHAIEYASRHWQVGGLKPLFLEISADMLKFVPFAQKAGMIYIGETEGNLKRAARDMSYLLGKTRGTSKYQSLDGNTCGFLDQQMARAHKAADLVDRMGWDIDELKARLKLLSTKTTLKDHLLFQGIVSFPKPTYLRGLQSPAHDFIRKRVAELAIRNGHAPEPITIDTLNQSIRLKNFTLTYLSQVRRTWQTQAVQKAFDISPENISHIVIKDLSLEIRQSEIVLLVGPSGSGKSTLLSVFAGNSAAGIAGEIELPENIRPGVFEPIRSNKALIEVLSPQNVEKTLFLLGVVGLSDAYVYLKRFSELSHGQQYRAMLARLLASGCNLWLADEFCAALDPLTANLVAHRLQKVSRSSGATLIVASSQPEMFVSALKPDKVITLTSAWEHKIISGDEFIDSLSNNLEKYEAPVLRISKNLIDAVRRGQSSLIFVGQKKFSFGITLLKSGSETHPVRVSNIRYDALRSLTRPDAIKLGFTSLKELKSILTRDHLRLNESSGVTIVDVRPA